MKIMRLVFIVDIMIICIIIIKLSYDGQDDNNVIYYFFYEDCSRSGNAMKVVIVAIMIKYDNNDED